jgi:hypothetical protein
MDRADLAAVGSAAISDANQRVRGCDHPVRMVGTTTRVDAGSGEILQSYSSTDELDGYTWIRCGNRRMAVCPSCAHEYKGDAWHVITTGVSGGKNLSESVRDHPAVFATLTAPGFGPVHGRGRTTSRQKAAPCRPRRDHPMCVHGRPMYCPRHHTVDDAHVGEPLCRDCYDYTAHVLWQWHAPELWRRFTLALKRRIATHLGLTQKALRDLATVSYTKVAEFQARGIVHYHAIIRLDGPHGPDTQPQVSMAAEDLAVLVKDAAASISVVAEHPDGHGLRLRWGTQTHTRVIDHGADRDMTGTSSSPAHPEQIAGYLAKYLTKATEEFGLPAHVTHPGHALTAGASDHVVRIIRTAWTLAKHTTDNDDEDGSDYGQMRKRLATLGYRGHVITKSRAYSTTFGQLRQARREWSRRKARLEPDAEIRDHLDPDNDQLADQTTEVIVRQWAYAGRGYLDLATAARAIATAVHTRSQRAVLGSTQ